MSRPLTTDLQQIHFNALDSLARHKYMMFGYWAAIWVYFNRTSGAHAPSPFSTLVRETKRLLEEGVRKGDL